MLWRHPLILPIGCAQFSRSCSVGGFGYCEFNALRPFPSATPFEYDAESAHWCSPIIPESVQFCPSVIHTILTTSAIRCGRPLRIVACIWPADRQKNPPRGSHWVRFAPNIPRRWKPPDRRDTESLASRLRQTSPRRFPMCTPEILAARTDRHVSICDMYEMD